MVENRHFDESANLTLPCALYMSKNVLFCPGQRLPQFGDDQQKYSEDLPKCTFFAHFQVVISNAYPLIWLLVFFMCLCDCCVLVFLCFWESIN